MVTDDKKETHEKKKNLITRVRAKVSLPFFAYAFLLSLIVVSGGKYFMYPSIYWPMWLFSFFVVLGVAVQHQRIETQAIATAGTNQLSIRQYYRKASLSLLLISVSFVLLLLIAPALFGWVNWILVFGFFYITYAAAKLSSQEISLMTRLPRFVYFTCLTLVLSLFYSFPTLEHRGRNVYYEVTSNFQSYFIGYWPRYRGDYQYSSIYLLDFKRFLPETILMIALLIIPVLLASKVPEDVVNKLPFLKPRTDA